jgi:hypothetical protein
MIRLSFEQDKKEMYLCKWSFMITFLCILLLSCNSVETRVSLKQESLQTLFVLVDALGNLQIRDGEDPNFGALRCDACNVLHTRAAEAVYPFAVAYKNSGGKKYLNAAINLGNWLIKQQLTAGEWKETPEEWTGTSTDQLLMLAATYPILEEHLTSREQKSWSNSIRRAADYLTKVMSPDFASINYCATTTVSLVFANNINPDKRYIKKAKKLADQVIAKMDEDGFICGEGGRVDGIKYGADVGYEIDMSLWGLGLYAKMTNDTCVDRYVSRSLANHLFFIYPNGAIDGSWGIRSNKWTVYGSATADGCQILFSLYTAEDARYRTAAMRNLNLLRQMQKEGIIGYGPQYWEIFDTPPCIYPTFVRAKNLAMTIDFGDQNYGPTPDLPTDNPTWVRHFPTVDVALTRSKNFMVTVTAYRYKDIVGRENSKYMHRPSGGTISNLWVKDYGFLQTASQTEYRQWEPMHFPEADGILPLTSRIEFKDSSGYYTNLYEFDGRFSVSSIRSNRIQISTYGYLKDNRQRPGGVAYRWTYKIFDNNIEKSVNLRYHGKRPQIYVVEPFINYPGTEFMKMGSGTVLIKGKNRQFQLKILKGKANIRLGENENRYWSPYPSIKCYPVTLVINPDTKYSSREIIYEISILK